MEQFVESLCAHSVVLRYLCDGDGGWRLQDDIAVVDLGLHLVDLCALCCELPLFLQYSDILLKPIQYLQLLCRFFVIFACKFNQNYMGIRELTVVEVEILRSELPHLIKQSSPLLQAVLKKLLRIINGEAVTEELKNNKHNR